MDVLGLICGLALFLFGMDLMGNALKRSEKVTYVQMTAEKAQKVVAEHLVNGKPVVEYTVGAVTK